MKTRIVQIGNSRGVRIPKQMLEQSGLVGEVELHAQKNGVLISPVSGPRAGWAEAARELAEAGDDLLLGGDGPPTKFDEEQWEW